MPRALLVALSLGAALLLASVGSLPSNAAFAAEDCDPARDHEAGDFTRALASGGFDREYILHVPPSYDGESPVPLVLNFHGLGSQASDQNDYSDLPAKADEEGFLVVAPQGTVTEFIPSRHWNFSTLEAFDDTPDDVAFVGELIEVLEGQLCIDRARIYSTGMSNGAQMSVRLACNLSERIAAIAPVSGVYYPPAFSQIPGEPACEAARPVPMIAFHGTDDGVIKFDGGPLGLEIPFSTRPIESAVIPEWADHNGCDPAPANETVTDNVRLVRYSSCRADVELYVVEGGRHEWPGASGGPGSPVGDEISATDLIWDFFQSHALDLEADGPVTPASQSNVALALPDAGGSDGNSVWLIVASSCAVVAVALGAALWMYRRRAS
jgi:polyhydroxybutyrate depolymerase